MCLSEIFYLVILKISSIRLLLKHQKVLTFNIGTSDIIIQ
jgi:hypothetical protein